MAATNQREAQTAAERLLEQLAVAGIPERASRERAYLKSALQHYGVPVPQVRALTKAWLRAEAISDHDEVMAAAAALWDSPVYESRSAAVEVLVARRRKLRDGDLPTCGVMLQQAQTWALVDPLAINVVGWICRVEPSQEAGSVLDRWAVDQDFWLRRAALLSQLPVVRTAEGNPSRFFGYADAMLGEGEFFIRKAIGWVLRDMGRRRRDEVFEWFLPRAARASGVTTREVVKILDEGQRAAIVAARTC
ncbi:MAG: hypothetical protein QG597_499 [Actinomycetota bacterium]|nr:hypothetical protein [Actinomycetota bacterium]